MSDSTTISDKLQTLLEKQITQADERHRKKHNFLVSVKDIIKEDGLQFELKEWRGFMFDNCPLCGRPDDCDNYGIGLVGVENWLCVACVTAFVPATLQVERQEKQDKADGEKGPLTPRQHTGQAEPF